MIKAILFDMDGTLLDSDELVLLIYQELTATFSPRIPLSAIAQRDLLAKSYGELLNILYGAEQDHLFAEIKKIHAKHERRLLRLFPHTRDMLVLLRKKGYQLGLVTSESRSIALEELHRMDIETLFDAIVTVDDIVRPKPAPDGIFAVLAQLGVAPSEALFVGDQPTDASAGQSASVLTVGMIWDSLRRNELSNAFDLVFSQWDELTHFLSHPRTLSPFVVKSGQRFRILQLTDLHLMGQTTDAMTETLIHDLVRTTHPAFIVLTGDQTMSPNSVLLYQKLCTMMDALKTPWTFVFGNHDTEETTYPALLSVVSRSKWLRFEPGDPTLGYSNFRLDLLNQRGKVLWHLFFLDTHGDETYSIDSRPTWGYSNVNPNQMDWYETELSTSQLRNKSIIPSLVFLHIPPFEYQTVTREMKEMYRGEYNEKPSTPPIDHGFITKAAQLRSTKAVFAGHDHLNDYTFEHKGMLLAYGRISGHYEYGMPGFPKGGRLIELDEDGVLHTEVVLHQNCQ